MGIRRWNDHQGRRRIYLSRVWPDTTRFRRLMPNMATARRVDARITEAVASGAWEALKAELARGAGLDDPTVEEFSKVYLRDDCQARNRRPDFKEQALTSIVRVLGDVRMRRLSRADAHRFVAVRSREVKPATVNRGLAVLKNMLSFAVDLGLVEHNPLLRFRMAREEARALRILSVGEFRALVDAVAQQDASVGALTALLGETGLRKSEGLRLEWPLVDFAERRLTVEESKSGEPRYVPLSQFAIGWLQQLTRVAGCSRVFVRSTGRPWKQPSGPFKKGCKAAKLEWVRGFHDLRHFRATQWLRHGVDVRTVQHLLGHADITTTMRYLRYLQPQAEAAVPAAEQMEASGR